MWFLKKVTFAYDTINYICIDLRPTPKVCYQYLLLFHHNHWSLINQTWKLTGYYFIIDIMLKVSIYIMVDIYGF